MEWIDKSGILAILVLHDEMTRKADTADRLSQTPRHLDVDEGQRYGYAHAVREHPIETTVMRVVIIRCISSQADFAKQKTIGRSHKFASVIQVVSAVGNRRGVVVEDTQIGIRFESGKLDGCELERGAIQFQIVSSSGQ